MKVKFVFLGGQNAGKTSILRRHFHGTFYANGRMPTIGADVYSTITTTRPSPSPSSTETSDVEEDKKEKRNDVVETTAKHNNHTAQQRRRPISIQVWDTPGRERFVNPNGKTRYTAYFSDNFLRNVDAVCLVYDVSSSTSFTHVLNWYYELIERIQRMKANHKRTRHLPIVIVGNKIDIFQDRDTRQKELLNRKKEVVRQRNVLGLTGDWRGRDYRYEYSANAPALTSSAPTKPSSLRKNSKNKMDGNTNDDEGRENRLELLTYLGTNTNYLEAILNNEVYRGSYFDSLLSSEDNSHPDKDMVQLWCMRNGLIHMDVSAKSGAGIDDLIHQLIDIALKQMDEDASTKTKTTAKNNHNRNDLYCTTLKRNDELDLHQRYVPKARSCFPLSFQCCCK